MKTIDNCKIAIIGLGCNYPGAQSPLQLWENVLGRRQQFRQMPDLRLPNSDYYDPDPLVADKTYLNKAAVLDGYSFNWLDKRIPKKTYESTDIAHWLALDTALQAIKDANYSKEKLPKETTGVIIGNTLTGEFTRSNQMLLRWPYVKKVLRASLSQKGLLGHFDALESVMEKYYKSVFAPVNEDTLAGGLANTIAGRVCNYLDINGGGYIVDGACSSSLLAIATAANYLELGQMDVVIAGGVDISLDTFELVGFAKTGALTRDEMRVYDKQGKGFIPGEGCGMVVLKRLEDAVRDKDQVYAIINGWGISSDGKGGITAPSAVGQSRALIRAYKKAGFETEKLDFIEGHGTGTTVGDRTELEGITLALNHEKELPKRNCGVTSFKSIVGHTKAAAGVGAFIKTVLALNRRVLPPTAGLKDFNPIFEEFASTLYPLNHGQVKDPKTILNAGVSAMGFGGINSHILLQSGDAPAEKFKPALEERKILVSNQTSEVFLFAADSKEELKDLILEAQKKAHGISYAELADFASFSNKLVNLKKSLRAAVVANNPFELERKLVSLQKELDKPLTDKITTLENDTIVFGWRLKELRIGALYPGQGAQKLNMTNKLVERFDWAHEFVNEARKILRKEGAENILDAIYKVEDRVKDKNEDTLWKENLKQTNVAQPAIIFASLLWQKYLEKLGLKFNCATGHSLGELMSFYAGGYYSEETLLRFAAFRGKSMSQCGSGTMASLVCTYDQAEKYIKTAPGYVTLANINAPEQTVISGENESVKHVIKEAEKDHIAAVELPVSAAFHSNLIAETAKDIKNLALLQNKVGKPNDIKLISSVTGQAIPEKTNLNEYFSAQAVNQVNFIKATQAIKDECDVLVEVGPGKVLSGLTSTITGDIKAFAVEAKANDDVSFNTMLANTYVRGADLNVEEIYRDRLIREFTPASQKEFIVNPLERPFPTALLTDGDTVETGQTLPLNTLDISGIDMHDYMNRRGDFIRDIILSDIKHLGYIGNNILIQASSTNIVKAKSPVIAQPVKPVTGTQSVKKVLTDKIEAATGFPSGNFTDDLKLLDDFNLDSIKAGALLADIAKTFSLMGKVTIADLSNASIGAIVERFTPFVKEWTASSSGASISSEDISNAVFDLVTEKTGFPKEQLDASLRLLNDLNLDSIKAGAFLTELLKKYKLQGKIEPAAYANASLGEIIEKISGLVVKDGEPITADQPQQSSVKSVVMELVADKTGFPVNDIKPEFRLLDDLNLDSIKAGAFIAALIKHYSLQGKMEQAAFSNASLTDIIDKINSLVGVPVKTSSPIPEKTDDNYWVRSFSVEIVPELLETSAAQSIENRKVQNLGLIYTGSSEKVRSVVELLHPTAEKTTVVDYKTLSTGANSFDRLIVFMPESDGNREVLNEAVALLSSVAQYSSNNAIELGFIQVGNGSFSRCDMDNKILANVFSAVAFASSLHLERPHAKIRAMEFDPSVYNKTIVELITAEFNTDDLFYSVGYNKNCKRQKMVYELAGKKSQKRLGARLTQEDVVLVTGGAKGITAECALALSVKYGCKMALVGSSALNSEVQFTLDRYSKLGLSAGYYVCNITDSELVGKVVLDISSEMGTITGVIHGAGMNIPRRAEQVSYEEASKEIAPKLIGAINLIESIQGSSLKYFVAFSSIIGVTGMQGNSWYAFSNETLDLLLRNLHKKHGTETLTLAYSIWSQVGMGERMGSTKALAHMGIGAITPTQGVEEFMRWIENTTNDQQIVVAAQLGGLDTWKRKMSHTPVANRYLENITYSEPGVQVVSRCLLNRLHDRYANDHNYNGSLLFPTVFGLEAMSQAAAYASGVSVFNSLKIENITLLKPIVIPDEGDLKIQVTATVLTDLTAEKGIIKVRAGISTEQSDFTDDHFSAEFVFNALGEKPSVSLSIPEKALPIDARTDLYSWLLFQGPTFQNIQKVFTLDNERAIFSTSALQSDTSDICFSTGKLAPFIMGSPLFRDMLLQSVQLILTQKIYLPIRIKEWEIFDIQNQKNGGFIECKLTEQDDQRGICDVAYVNDKNEVLEQIRGYEVKALKPTANYPLPDEIASMDELICRKIAENFKKFDALCEDGADKFICKQSDVFGTLSKEKRHTIEQNIFEKQLIPQNSFGLKEGFNQLVWDSNGKPGITNSDFFVSLSHSGTLLCITTGQNPQGCDIEYVENRTKEEWLVMLDHKFSSVLDELNCVDGDTNVSATRIWSARESVYKSTGILPSELKAIEISEKGVVFEATVVNEKIQVLTFDVEILPRNTVMVSYIVRLKKAAPTVVVPPIAVVTGSDDMFDAVSGKFVNHFLTTFKDCKGFYGKTYFTNFPLWMGQLRELVLSPVSRQLLDDFRTGQFGMVTNVSSVKIYNEAESLNKIIGKIWITDKSDLPNSFIDLNFEWFRKDDNGMLVKLADCNLSTTWVRIEGHGVVKQSPLPAYFESFLSKHLRKSGSESQGRNSADFITKDDLGKVVYESQSKPRPELQILRKTFQTGIYDGNSVGNLYYSNYYDWQAKSIEYLIHKIDPEIFPANGRAGEFISLRSNVNHLQEAMPFEEIEVDMYLEKRYENGVKLYFEYFSLSGGGKRKLAYGNNTVIWASRSDEKSQPIAHALPHKIEKFLKELDKKNSLLPRQDAVN